MKTDNELIAEFDSLMEWYVPKNTNYLPYWRRIKGDVRYGHFRPYELKYDTSWDWLMPVVEKTHETIETMERKYPDEKDIDDPTGWRAWNYRRPSLVTDITKTYRQVVDFIKWYNDQKK